MSETELLELCENLKNKIVELKNKDQDLKAHFKQLKEYCDGLEETLKAKEAEIEELKTSSKAQIQQTTENAAAAKEAFMSELSRVIEDANKALED